MALYRSQWSPMFGTGRRVIAQQLDEVRADTGTIEKIAVGERAAIALILDNIDIVVRLGDSPVVVGQIAARDAAGTDNAAK